MRCTAVECEAITELRPERLFGGSIRFSTTAVRSGEYPMLSSYPAHLRNRKSSQGACGKVVLDWT